MDFLLAIIGGSCGAAIVTGLFGLVKWRLDRKAQKEDRAANSKVADCAARGEEIRKLKERTDALIVAERESFYNKIKALAKEYIKRSWVSVEEYEDLKRMHKIYHDPALLGGNGFLDDLMKDVDHLEKRVL
jgi:hypothetical protein